MNFCIEKIGTTISTSQVESDGNECKNLLEPESTRGDSVILYKNSSRGFLSDHFVRPPVTLNIQFPSCLEISHIVINPKYGTQASSAFVIQTETSFAPWRSGQEVKSAKHIVAKEYINSTTIPNSIIFRNPRFVARPPFSLLRTSSTPSSSDELSFNLKHPSINACERVIGLEVTILRVVGSSVPALGGIQVWGQPCVRCPKDVANKLLVAWMRRSKKRSAKDAVPDPTNTDEGRTPKRSRLDEFDSNSVEVPEEFLDPITHEIMCQPIRLPCAVAVDATTLEKYYKEEATWARPPNDPFTGQAYTDSIKPIADGALKTRIDYFLTQNSHCKNIQSLPRTVSTGSAGIPGFSRHQFTTFKSNKGFSTLLLPPLPPPSLPLSNFKTVSSATEKTNKLKPKPKPSASITSQTNDKADQDSSLQTLTLPLTTLESQSSRSGSMDYYLKEEMAKILGGGYSYVSRPPEKPPLNYLNQCIKCKEPLEKLQNNTTVYSSTTCPHICVCRPCVLKMDKQEGQICSECTLSWTAKDLQRNHHDR